MREQMSRTTPAVLQAKARKVINHHLAAEALQKEAQRLGIPVVQLKVRKFQEVQQMRRNSSWPAWVGDYSFITRNYRVPYSMQT